MSDQEKISSYNINTISVKQTSHENKEKNINKGIISSSNLKFSKLTLLELYGR